MPSPPSRLKVRCLAAVLMMVGKGLEPPPGAEVIDAIDEQLLVNTYRLFLDEGGQLRWHDETRQKAKVWEVEPETSATQRASVRAMGILPIESQL